MAVKCTTFGGRIGWILRKHFSCLTSKAYLDAQYIIRRRLYKKYMRYFNEQKEVPKPCLISIETINRCNGTCDFCPANRNLDKRPFQKMSERLFQKIIRELKDIDYDGYLNLYVNNEPLIDSRIEVWYAYAKEQLPNAKMLLYTNGLLMSKERFDKIVPYVDKMIINDYSEKLKLHENISLLYSYIKSKPEYRKRDIKIQIRYIHEILTNRAGNAPNKKKKKKIHWGCIMPFTDMTIFPNGVVGLCCSDVLEKTNYGNIKDTDLWTIWKSSEYQSLRKVIGEDRENYEFCKGCDFFDAGIRNMFIKKRLNFRKCR